MNQQTALSSSQTQLTTANTDVASKAAALAAAGHTHFNTAAAATLNYQALIDYQKIVVINLRLENAAVAS